MPRRPLASIFSYQGRETQLNNVTKEFILGMSKTGAKHQEIKGAVGRQKSTIRMAIFNDHFGYTKVSKEQRGRPQHLSCRVQFTSTHPLLEYQARDSPAVDARIPALRFDALVVHEPAAQNGDETFCDLILEPLPFKLDSRKAEILPSYVLSELSGDRLLALSEAPIVDWFSLELLFIGNVITACALDPAGFQGAKKVIESETIFTSVLLRGLEDEDISNSAEEALYDISLQSLLNGDDAQAISDLIERLVMRLGRTIGKEIAFGWLKREPIGRTSTNVLLIHDLRLLDGELCTGRHSIPDRWRLRVRDGDNAVYDQHVDVAVQGSCTMILNQCIKLESMLTRSKAQNFIALDLEGESREGCWKGSGPLVTNVQSVMSIGKFRQGRIGWHAVVELEIRSVSLHALQNEVQRSEHEVRAYAASLGYAFGMALV